jgi:hypothetical protein
MADNITKEVLLRVKLDPSDLEKQGDVLQKSLNKLKEETKKLNKELNDKNTGVERRKEIEDQLLELGRKTKEYSKQISANNKEIEFQIKLNNAQEGSNEQLRLQLSALTKTYNGLSKEARENSAEGQALQKTIKGISDTLKENESAVGDNRRNVGNYKEALEETLAPLLKQREALLAQKEALKQSGEQQDNINKKPFGFGAGISKLNATTEGVNNFNASLNGTSSSIESVDSAVMSIDQSLAELDQEIKRTEIGFNAGKQSVKEYDNTLEGMTEKLSDLKKLAPTLDLNSEEYKKTNEAIRETQFEIDKAIGKVDEFGNKEPKNPAKEAMDDTFEAATALTSSIGLLSIAFGESEDIQEVQKKALQAVAIAQTAANIAKSKGAIISTIELVKTKAATAAQIVYTTVIGASTGALKAFKIALATTGVGALVVGLGLLIAYLARNKTKVVELTEAEKNLKEATEKLREEEIKEVVQATKLFGELQKSNAGSKQRKQLIDQVNSTYGTTLKNLSDEAAFLAAVAKAQEQVIKNIQIKISARIKETQLEAAITDLLQKQEFLNESQVKRGDLILQLKKATNDEDRKRIQAELDSISNQDKLKKNIDNVINSQNDYGGNQDRLLKVGENVNDQAILGYVEQKIRVDELTQELVNLQSQVTTTGDKTKKSTQDNLTAILAFQKKILGQSKDLQTEAIQDQQKQEIEALFTAQDRQKLQLLEEFKNLKATNEKEKAEKEKARIELQKLLLEIDEETANKQEEIVEKFNAQRRAKDQEEAKRRLDIQVINLAVSKEARRLDIEETIKDEKKKSIALIQLEIDTQKELLRIAEESAKVDNLITPEEVANIETAKLKLRELEIQLKQINEQPIAIIPKDFEEKFKQVADIVSQVFGSLADAVNAAFNGATAQVEQLGAAQVKAIEKTTLTEKQKQKQIEKINEETARKKYQLDVDQFNFNKGVQITQAIISTASAVIAALANPVPFVGAVLAGVAAATGAVQIGIIAAQQPPPPPFYEGGYTGDGNPREESRALGRKSYTYHKGEYVVPNKILKTETGSALVSTLERMRLGKISSLGLSGFADGGFTANDIRAGVVNAIATDKLAAQISDAISNVQIITKVTDINRVNNQLAQNKIAATLR